jgi:serine/threonine protein kinase
MAPEVKNEKPYGTKADIYSVGVVAYELYSGELPTYESL